jgi:ammonium transporter, Amt family
MLDCVISGMVLAGKCSEIGTFLSCQLFTLKNKGIFMANFHLFRASIRAALCGCLITLLCALPALAQGTPNAGATSPTAVVSTAAVATPVVVGRFVKADQINSGDTAWLLASTALVLMMTLPGLAFFYAGLVRKKNILSMMTHVFIASAMVTVVWFTVGYPLAFVDGNAWIGTLSAKSLFVADMAVDPSKRVAVHSLANTIPELAFSLYQAAFAVITAALIVGGFAERVKFGVTAWFCGLWTALVYAPVAHWVWAPTGWLNLMGVADFAGGTVVHVNAGAAALACALVVGPRQGYGKEPMVPANLAYMLIGTGLLWVGWFGFNGGSAMGANMIAGLAMVNTQIAAAMSAIVYVLLEWALRGKSSLVGLATGAVAGLVAITPAAGYVTPLIALAFGAAGALASYVGVTVIKGWIGADDSLDVFAIHGVTGIVGSLLTGLLAQSIFLGRQPSFTSELTAVGAVLVYSFITSFVIMKLLDIVIGARVSADDERDGLDLSQHGEQVN